MSKNKYICESEIKSIIFPNFQIFDCVQFGFILDLRGMTALFPMFFIFVMVHKISSNFLK